MTIKKKKGRPSKAYIKALKDESEKVLITRIVAVIGIILIVGIFCQNLWADQIVHKFKSPSFNGIGTSVIILL